MSLFKTTDEKLKDLGFKKELENEHIVHYLRQNEKFTQVVDIVYKAYGWPILQSYDPELHDAQCIGNTCVGLTYPELKLFTKKIEERHWDKI